MDHIIPVITDWTPTSETAMTAANWFKDEYLEVTLDVDEKGMLGWFMAQGWDVTSSSENSIVGDQATVVKSITYQLRRRKLQSELVLQSMINEFTGAYNEGRELNDTRYDEVVTIFTTMLDKTEDELIALEADDDTYDGVIEALITSLSDDFDALDDSITAIIEAMQTSHDAYKTIIDAMETEVEGDHDTYETAIEALTVLVESSNDDHDTTMTTLTDGMDTQNASYASSLSILSGVMVSDYSTMSALIESVIGSIESDYSTFSSSMSGVLSDYGVSIRAEINTRFDNKLTSTRQDLVSKGLYNSTLWVSVAAGVERERTFSLNDVADKITQQEISLTQSVYREQAQMRERVISARDGLFVRLQGIRQQQGATYDRINSAYIGAKSQIASVLNQLESQVQQTYATRLSAESNIYAAKVDMRSTVNTAKDRLQAHLDTVQDRRMSAQMRLFELQSGMRGKVIASRDRLNSSLRDATDRRVVLRNAVVTALAGFMERRTDDYPGIGQLASIAASLGYADGGTVAPS